MNYVPEVCPYCGGEIAYIGVDDGCGPYGSSVCDIWECVECQYQWEGTCIDYVQQSESAISDSGE